MPNLNQITITLPLGPGRTVSSLVLTGVTEVNFKLGEKMVLEVHHDKEPGIAEFDFDAAATVTYSITGQNSTVVVSS